MAIWPENVVVPTSSSNLGGWLYQRSRTWTYLNRADMMSVAEVKSHITARTHTQVWQLVLDRLIKRRGCSEYHISPLYIPSAWIFFSSPHHSWPAPKTRIPSDILFFVRWRGFFFLGPSITSTSTPYVSTIQLAFFCPGSCRSIFLFASLAVCEPHIYAVGSSGRPF